MRNIYFDLCAIPIYALILWSSCFRGMTKGHANRVFIMMNAASLACAAAEVAMELLTWHPPLSPAATALGTALAYAYFVLRHGTLVVYLYFVFVITRTDYRIRPLRRRLLLWLPNALLLLILAQNLLTHSVFAITAADGYTRGPAMAALYVIAAVYGGFGAAYCVYCKRFLTLSRWLSLISVYVFTCAAALAQRAMPSLLVEMFSTAAGLLMIMLLVMRPEETMDFSVGILSWKAYQTDLRNLLLSGERARVMVVRIMNAHAIRAYLGDDRYGGFIRSVADALQGRFHARGGAVELYFEAPDALYLIVDDASIDLSRAARDFADDMAARADGYSDMGIRLEPKICLIRCPEDLTDAKDILNLGHRFPRVGRPDKVIFSASEILKSGNFEIENHMEEILNRAITENRLEMYYQPIYDVKAKRFRSAEALVRLNDSRYGMIPPGLFIPAAEAMGLVLPIGEIVMESVFRFIADHDLDALGLDYIEINLSVAQCMQRHFPDKVERLRQKYGIRPEQVNLEITETMFDNMGDVVEKNLRALYDRGYRFSLDDYGTGYSNIQRLSRLPLSLIKIDKSLVDDLFTPHGQVIMRNTVRMMHGIEKALVIEGVETETAVAALSEMSCDFIQGYYFSKPLPGQAFLDFLQSKCEACPASA